MILRRIIHHYFNVTTFLIFRAIIIASIPASFMFVFFWQNIAYANIKRQEQALTLKKEKLIRKNNELRVDIASSASAERIESLYKKVYNYLPTPGGTRILTLTLPSDSDIIESNQ